MPRPATVLVHGSEAEVIKRAETPGDVFRRAIWCRRGWVPWGPDSELGLDPDQGLGAGSGGGELPQDEDAVDDRLP